MKQFALIATSLALFSAGAVAQEAAPTAPQIKVTTGSFVTFYSVEQSEQSNQKRTIRADKITFNDEKDVSNFEGNVQIQLLKSFQLHTDKVSAKGLRSGNFSLLLQSDGKIDFVEDGHPVTQFVAQGTTIEFLPAK